MTKLWVIIFSLLISTQGYSGNFEEIQKLIVDKNLEVAAEAIRSKSAQDLSPADLRILLADFYVASGSPSKAIETYKEAEFLSLGHTDLINAGLANGYLALHQYQKAEKYAQKALKANADLIWPRLVLISLSDHLGLEGVDEQYLRLLEITNQNSLVWRHYLEYALQKDVSSAYQLAQKAYVAVGEDPHILELLGQVSLLVGDGPGGIDYFVRAKKLFAETGNLKHAGKIDRWIEMNSSVSGGSLKHSESTGQQSKLDDAEEGSRDEQEKKPENAGSSEHMQLIEVDAPDSITLDFSKPFRTGSGFVISAGSYVVTNKHVVEGWSRIQVRNGLGEMREASFVIMDAKEDLAVIGLKNPFKKDFSLSFQQIRDPRPGEEVFLMGYPLVGVFGDVYPTISEGIVSKVYGFQEARNGFILTAGMNPGNSGGPIFGEDGYVLGVAVAKLDKQEFLEEKGTLPEDVNTAIKSGSIIRFLESEGLLSSKGEEHSKINGRTYDAQSIYSVKRGSVVLIAVEGKE